MKVYFIILLALLSKDPREIAKINALKKEAEKAYLAGDFQLAVSKYTFLTDSMNVVDDLIHLNLGHAYYQLGDTTGAKTSYGKVITSGDRPTKSIALQQLGVMSKEANKLEEALQQLKSSIKADPSNRDAVYDYEVVKKLLEEQKKQDQQNQDQNKQDQNEDQQEKDGEKQDQENQEQDKEGEKEDQQKKEGENEDASDEEKKNQEPQQDQQKEGEEEQQEEQKSQEQMTKEKLEEMGISEEKARQLLEAMQQSEIKYLQNQKRKATKRPPSGKPDW